MCHILEESYPIISLSLINKRNHFGIFFADLGTSPLYVFADVFTKVPIESDVDVLGALSLVMYRIALLPLLKANDKVEGMGFSSPILIEIYC